MKTLLCCLLLSSVALAGDAGENRLVMDLGHGVKAVAAPLEELGKTLGVDIQPVRETVTSAALQGARAFYLRTPTKPYSPEEQQAVIDFVRGGGSLLVVFDEERNTPLAPSGLNDILKPLGFELTDDTEYLHNTGGLAKAGLINAADRELPFSGGRAVRGGTPFAWQLDRDGKPAQPFASYALIGSARVVVMSEAMASAFLGKPEGVRLTGVPRDPANTVYWGKDSAKFMEEVVAWLIRR
jgi:hypothetical protein